MLSQPPLPPEYVALALVCEEVGRASAYLTMLEDGMRDRDQTISDLRSCIQRISGVVLGK